MINEIQYNMQNEPTHEMQEECNARRRLFLLFFQYGILKNEQNENIFLVNPNDFGNKELFRNLAQIAQYFEYHKALQNIIFLRSYCLVPKILEEIKQKYTKSFDLSTQNHFYNVCSV